MQCITTTSSCISMNGEHLRPFHPTRGLRQGDFLSPYLFILMANLLSYLIHNGVDIHRWCPTLSHLLFANDAIFFLDGTIHECHNLLNVLNQYCLATDQEVNRKNLEFILAKIALLLYRRIWPGRLEYQYCKDVVNI